jgi:Ni/Fe-hydrogenase subunit HybB-like protein
MLTIGKRDKEALLDPLFRAGWRFYTLIGVLLVIMGWGGFLYVRQLILGLGVTGMDRPAYWGMYMVNFIFFIGISHAGTLISAILRVTQAEWRRPITRIAEAITAFALIVGTLQIFFDLGRPDRILFLFRYGRLQSPLLWDAVSVTAYFLGSLTYLYLPIMPDAALLRDNLPEGAPAWRRRLYSMMALGWRGNRTQWLRLEKMIAVLAVLIIPIAISVHTVISWILATTVQPGWHSTVFGPYFVVGAIFSGIGALFIAMTVTRRALHLEAYITDKQFRYLGYIFITMSAIWFYFTYAEHMTQAAGQLAEEFPILASKLWGPFSGSFWLMIFAMVVAFVVLVFPLLTPDSWQRSRLFHPLIAVALGAVAVVTVVLLRLPRAQELLPELSTTALQIIAVVSGLLAVIAILPWLKRHLVDAMVFASILVLLGMWLERWNIVVPTMVNPRLMPASWYAPSLTEWSLFAASIALFIFMFAIFFKLVPAISVWEVREGQVIDEAHARAIVPMPETSPQPVGLQPAYADDKPA